jgi:hypothetical protein
MSRLEAPATTEAGPPPAAPKSPVRQLLTWVGLLVLVVTAVLGSNMFSLRDRLFGTATPDPAPPAASRVAGSATQDTVAAAPTSLRSNPWWQDVTTLDGTGATTSSPFTIASGAIQWRVTWSCSAGHITVKAPKQTKAVVDGTCPNGPVGYAIGTGAMTVQVTADGPWHLVVAQQVDVPLVEPPLPAMTAAGSTVVGTGPLYNIDKTGTGKVTIYHQADGRYSVRLEDFFVSPNVDLELRLSALDAPHSSSEFANAPNEVAATMDVTAGSVNYTLAPGVDPTKYKSLVVWCVPIKSAYAAATLGGPR